MSTCIVKLDSFYLEWSFVSDAPLTWGMPLDAFRLYFEEQYGKTGLVGLPSRLRRCEEYGSSMYERVDVTRLNRAGPRGESLTRDQLIARFCLSQDARQFQAQYATRTHTNSANEVTEP